MTFSSEQRHSLRAKDKEIDLKRKSKFNDGRVLKDSLGVDSPFASPVYVSGKRN